MVYLAHSGMPQVCVVIFRLLTKFHLQIKCYQLQKNIGRGFFLKAEKKRSYRSSTATEIFVLLDRVRLLPSLTALLLFSPFWLYPTNSLCIGATVQIIL